MDSFGGHDHLRAPGEHVECHDAVRLAAMKRALEQAKRAVDRAGILLVYPMPERAASGRGITAEIPSLWSELYPRSKMEWSWNADADPRVAEVWHLRERLAHTHDVAYAKWFRGRATFFSLPVFTALLGRLAARGDVHAGLPAAANDILDLLRERSPLSTKQVRAATDLRGKANEARFVHAMKALWARLLVVGTGEVPDGAFPSLAFGATELLFEDEWGRRLAVPKKARAALDEALERTPAWRRELDRSLRQVEGPR